MNDRDKLLYLLDGNLPPQEARELEARMAQNAELREAFDCLNRIQARIASRPPEPSPGLWDDIEAQLRTEEMADPLSENLVWVGKRLAPLMAAAAIVLMTILNSANGETLDDFFASQTELVLSAIDADAAIPISDTFE